jgi:type VI secretion system protein ImpM
VAADTTPGFYGKLPALGDFVTRRLPREGFLDTWDTWLSEGLRQTREAMGDAWLPTYLTSPVWRFAISAGVCGPDPWAGVLMPSVDRVGRYFPLTLAVPLPKGTAAIGVAACDPWFAKAEALALSALEDPFDLETFDHAVEDLGAPPAPDLAPPLPDTGDVPGVQIELGPDALAGAGLGSLAAGLLEARWPRHSVWWTGGSERIRPTLAVCRHLPHGVGFAAMLDGAWQARGWYTQNRPRPREAQG